MDLKLVPSLSRWLAELHRFSGKPGGEVVIFTEAEGGKVLWGGHGGVQSGYKWVADLKGF